jgi:hypothetical protein
LSIPAQFHPNDAADVNRTKAISSAAETTSFTLRMAARTLDTDLDADDHFFEQGRSSWTVDNAWPVVAGVSIVTSGPAWRIPGSATEIDIHIVPAVTNSNDPFLRWEH